MLTDKKLRAVKLGDARKWTRDYARKVSFQLKGALAAIPSTVEFQKLARKVDAAMLKTNLSFVDLFAHVRRCPTCRAKVAPLKGEGWPPDMPIPPLKPNTRGCAEGTRCHAEWRQFNKAAFVLIRRAERMRRKIFG
jgi:hypothetical protein